MDFEWLKRLKRVLSGKLELGRIKFTDGAWHAMMQNGVFPPILLDRHESGDWGDIPEEERRKNDFARTHGLQVRSTYKLANGAELLIVTEADRCRTTLLLPEECRTDDGPAAFGDVTDKRP